MLVQRDGYQFRIIWKSLSKATQDDKKSFSLLEALRPVLFHRPRIISGGIRGQTT